MTFFEAWLSGYWRPRVLVEALVRAPAPRWGWYAVLIRGLLDSLLLYLPLALMGRVPSTPSTVTILPTERYYHFSVLFVPLFFIALWLLVGAAVHLALCLSDKRSDFNQILNITGMTGLVVGAFLVVWDWAWVLLALGDPVALGVSHLILDLWGVAITILAYKRILELPVRMGVLLSLLAFGVALPPAMIFMRSPL
jgi:hypothetical protein